MAFKLKKKFSWRKSTPDLSEWGKHDAKLIDALNKDDTNKINSVLTKKGISPTKLDPSGLSVFHRAAADNKPHALEIFIKHKADVNCRDINDKTPLHSACSKGNAECVEILLEAGASPLCEDRVRRTPLHYAAGFGSLSVLELLLCFQDAPLNKPDEKGETPLHLATAKDATNVCEELLRHGANINVKDINNRTPLMLAAARGNIHLVQLFVDSGADVFIQDKKGYDAMQHAATAGKSDVEAYLDNVKKSGGGRASTFQNNLYEDLDVQTSVEPINHHDSSDDETGYVVPIDQHPSTSNKEMKPQYVNEVVNRTASTLSQSTDEQDAYKVLEANNNALQLENNQLRAQRDRLGYYIVTNMAVKDWVKIQAEIASSFENEIHKLNDLLQKEKRKTAEMETTIKLLQSQLQESQNQIRPTTSESDLREMAAFSDIQEAHEKEVTKLNIKIEHLKKSVNYPKFVKSFTNIVRSLNFVLISP